MVRPPAFRSFQLLALVFTFVFILNLQSVPRMPHVAASARAQGTPLPAPVPVWRLIEGPKDASLFGLTVLNGQLYAATLNGVWASADNGATWQARNTGLPDLAAASLHAQDGVLFVATNRAFIVRATADSIGKPPM
jgi:hypothetical protein